MMYVLVGLRLSLPLCVLTVNLSRNCLEKYECVEGREHGYFMIGISLFGALFHRTMVVKNAFAAERERLIEF